MAENEKMTRGGGTRMPAGNPLLSKNIPPPPPPALPEQDEKDRSGIETMAQVERIPVEQIPPPGKNEEERATIELSLYLRPAQDDKLEDLRRSYKRRTGKKISANEVIRRLIEHATLEMLEPPNKGNHTI